MSAKKKPPTDPLRFPSELSRNDVHAAARWVHAHLQAFGERPSDAAIRGLYELQDDPLELEPRLDELLELAGYPADPNEPERRGDPDAVRALVAALKAEPLELEPGKYVVDEPIELPGDGFYAHPPPKPEPFVAQPVASPKLARMVCTYCGVERGGPGHRSPRFCPKDKSGQHWHNFETAK